MGRFEFTITGEPVPKGSRIVGTRKDGSRFTREASKRARPWMVSACQQLAEQANTPGSELFSGATCVHLTFYCARPGKPTHAWPSRGDLDKFVRATLDALKLAGVISDDRHVIDVAASKRYTGGEPRTAGWIEPANPLAPTELVALEGAAA